MTSPVGTAPATSLDMSSDPPQVDRWLSLGLAFVGGYGDASGFLVANTFTGHVTGNLVLVAIDLVRKNWAGTFGHLFAVLSFLSGVSLSVLLTRTRNPWSLRKVMLIEGALMCIAAVALSSHAFRSAELFVFCVALALGLQNGTVRRAGGFSIHTTYLTGMITNLMITETGSWFSAAGSPPVSVQNLEARLIAGIWVLFVLGAATGALTILGFKDLGFAGAPVLLLGLLLGNAVSFPAMRRAYGR